MQHAKNPGGGHPESVLQFYSPRRSLPIKRSIQNALLLLLIPLSEYLFFRFYLHSVLHLKIGWGPLLTDYDLFLPLPAAFIFFIVILEKKMPLEIRPRVFEFGIHAAAFATFLSLNENYVNLSSSLGNAFQAIWWLSVLGLFASAVMCQTGARFFFSNPNRGSIVICAMIAFTTILSTQFGALPWRALSPRLSEWVCSPLHTILGTSVTCDVRDGFHLFLIHPLLAIKIAKGCGGIDGYLLMCSVVSLTSILFLKNFSFGKCLLYGVLSFFLITFLNVLRIGLLFTGGVYLVRHFGVEVGMPILATAFHANLGWLLYGVGLYFLCRVMIACDEFKFSTFRIFSKKQFLFVTPERKSNQR